MAVPVMLVWIVRMAMSQRRVMMAMGMGFARRIVRTMLVLVMRVVNMAVFVIQDFMRVLVRMRFGQVQV